MLPPISEMAWVRVYNSPLTSGTSSVRRMPLLTRGKELDKRLEQVGLGDDPDQLLAAHHRQRAHPVVHHERGRIFDRRILGHRDSDCGSSPRLR